MPLVLARVLSAALRGVEAVLVRVEVDVAAGLPAFTTVWLPDSAVRGSGGPTVAWAPGGSITGWS